ncbi:MAG: peptide deformylase [Planctomycetales bacterium]
MPSTVDTLEIVHYPHPALRWKSKPIVRIDDELRGVVRRMFELMYEFHGIGLAANQVGLPYRLFVVNVSGEQGDPDEEVVFLNPEITRRKGSKEEEEGCLSLPELFGPVRRAEEVVVEAFDLEGREFRMNLDDLPARAIQHELDHIDGVLFIDRMTDAARRELEERIADFESHFRRQQESGRIPSDEEIRRQLRALEPS